MEDLIAKYLSGNATEEEKSKVLAWRSESEHNAQAFFELRQGWVEADVSEPNLKMLNDVLNEPEAKVIGWPGYLKYAAAVILLAMIGAIWYFDSGSGEGQPVFAGSSVVLSDGTLISLKDGSSIISEMISDESREIEIEGKAFFEVAHDNNRPFIVKTKNADVKVLGTKFLVDSQSEYTQVCVESGKVNMATKIDNTGERVNVDLTKGEMGVVEQDVNGIVKREIDNRNFLAWKNGLMEFEGARMEEVINVLEDAYGKKILLSENMKNCSWTVRFDKKTLEEVIKILSVTFNWQYDIDKNKVVLSGEGC